MTNTIANISINNGNSYVTVADLAAEDVHNVYEQVTFNPLNDDVRYEAEEASFEFDGIDAERAFIAKVAEMQGEIVLG